MPITFRIDRPARLIRAAVRGDFTAAEMLATVTAAAVQAGPGFAVLSDHREIGEPATREQIEQLVEHLAALQRHFAHARWAVIVSKPASFGMMRMLEMMVERVPMTVRVFVDAERAERWARGDTSPELEAADPPPAPRGA